jgi:hypothetical protein
MKPILYLVALMPLLLTGCISIGGGDDVYYEGPCPPGHHVVVYYNDPDRYCEPQPCLSARESNDN